MPPRKTPLTEDVHRKTHPRKTMRKTLTEDASKKTPHRGCSQKTPEKTQ